MIKIRVHGIPAPQGSKRHVGGGRMIESSARVAPWREAVRAEAQRYTEREQRRYGLPGLSEAGAVAVGIVFIFARPGSHFGSGRNARQVRPSAPARPASRGRNDIDKLARSTLDGLVSGGILADDGLVVDLTLAKVYAEPGEAPGAVIEVEAAASG
jgi:crossover junction endodeoxyribonuclease RusA